MDLPLKIINLCFFTGMVGKLFAEWFDSNCCQSNFYLVEILRKVSLYVLGLKMGCNLIEKNYQQGNLAETWNLTSKTDSKI